MICIIVIFCVTLQQNRSMMENPFYITGIIPEPYFCDREKETLWMVRTLDNKAHILLFSPRRMGKTQSDHQPARTGHVSQQGDLFRPAFEG